MKPTRLDLVGITRFRRPLSLDLSTLPDGLIAVIGENGAGKSTLLECMVPGALYRDLPSYGPILESAVARDAHLEVTFVDDDGTEWTTRQDLDIGTRREDEIAGVPEAEQRKSPGKALQWLTRDGGKLHEHPRTGDFDAAVAEVFPTRDVLLASVFAVQDGTGDFGANPPGTTPHEAMVARRDLFSDLLGNRPARVLADRAKAARRDADRGLRDLAEDLEALSGDVLRLRGVREDLEAARAEVAAVAPDLEAARTAHAATMRAHGEADAKVDANRRDREDALARIGTHETRAETADRRREAAEHRLEALRATLDKAEAVRATADRCNAADAALREGEPLVASLRAKIDGATATRDDRARALVDLRARHRRGRELVDPLPSAEDLEARVAALSEAAGDLDEDLEAPLRSLRDAVRAARDGVSSRRSDLTLRRRDLEATVRTTTSRLEDLRRRASLLDEVPCGGREIIGRTEGHPAKYAAHYACHTCDLLKDARAAKDGVAEAEAALEEARTGLEALTADEAALAADNTVGDAETRLRDAETATEGRRRARRDLKDAEAARDQARRYRDTLAEVDADLAALEASFETAKADLAAAGDEYAKAREAGDVHRATLRDAPETWRDDVREVERAEVLLPEVEGNVTRHREEAEAARKAAGEVKVPPRAEDLEEAAKAAGMDVARAKVALREVEDRHTAAAARVAALTGEADGIGDVEARYEDLDTRRKALERRRRGFDLVARSCGRHGFPALEIDAYAPEVAEHATEVLRGSFGDRWTLDLRTTRPSKDRKRVEECFDVLVHDGEREGAARTLDRLSVGERALISLALKLSIAVFNAARHGVRFRALFLDEKDSGLSPARADLYPTIVRRAADLGGFSQVFVITHRPSVIAQCDGALVLKDGDARALSTPEDVGRFLRTSRLD